MPRNLKTCLLIATWVFVGIFTAIIGASIIDLTEIADCDLEQIGQVLIGLNLAMPLGSIVAGIVCNNYYNDLDLVISTFVMSLALSSAALPWCPDLGLMATVMVIQGVSRGIITCCGNVMVVNMWLEKSPAPLHAMHFGTGFGSFIAPLMLQPFLSKYGINSTSQAHGREQNTTAIYSVKAVFENSSILLNNRLQKQDDVTTSNIWIPYTLMGGFGIVCSVGFLLFYCKFLKNLNANEKNNNQRLKGTMDDDGTVESPLQSPKQNISAVLGSCANGDAFFGAQMAGLLFFFYACVVGLVMSYPTYLLPVVINGELKLSKQEGAYLTSGYWGSFAAGRFVAAPLSKIFSVQVMFIFELFASVLTAALLAFNGSAGLVNLWAYTCAFAFISAPLFPSGIAWAERYVDINGPIMALLQSGVGFGSFIASWLGGFGLEHFTTSFPLHLNFAFSIGALVLFFLMQTKGSLRGTKSSSVSYEKVDTIDERLQSSVDTYM